MFLGVAYYEASTKAIYNRKMNAVSPPVEPIPGLLFLMRPQVYVDVGTRVLMVVGFSDCYSVPP